MTNSWDDLKRVKEEEYFLREEKEKLRRLRDQVTSEERGRANAQEALSNFQKGHSPITGATMYRASVDDIDIIDCPEEGVLMMTYNTLETLLDAAADPKSPLIKSWRHFLKSAAVKDE